ncbi:MAG TPA: formate dehydrogenase, partial [Rhodobacterales bacterium]|nr:formate dehydrogenase [Rhodobacterales bacterium]
MTRPENIQIETSPPVSDEIRKTTCYMCACRCGINVHMKDGQVAYIEGNRDHPVNQGVLCGKGSSGIMSHYAPSRLRAPLKRVGPRGSGEFEEISWEEALDIAVGWLEPIRQSDPKKLAFFTGRDQSQSFTSLFAQNYGTPNYAAHGGFCSVNMAAGGIYTMGGAFWEFGQPDWERTKLFVLFGVAEDHDSNPIKIGIGKMKANGGKVMGINPIRSGYNAVADDWVGITPGTDGLLILSIIHELFRSGKVDLDYLRRYTNAGYLVNEAEGPEKGLFIRDKNDKPQIIDQKTGKAVAFDKPGSIANLAATKDGNRTVFQLMAEKYLSDEYAPEAVAERCGLTAERIRNIAAEFARVAFEEE